MRTNLERNSLRGQVSTGGSDHLGPSYLRGIRLTFFGVKMRCLSIISEVLVLRYRFFYSISSIYYQYFYFLDFYLRDSHSNKTFLAAGEVF